MLLKVPSIFHSNSALNKKLSNTLALIVAFQLAAVIIKACTPASFFELMNLSIEQFHLITFGFSLLMAIGITIVKDTQQDEISACSAKD